MNDVIYHRAEKSHPARGAWIEIMKRIKTVTANRRTPRGVRGLKYEMLMTGQDNTLSHPARGAWIEILKGTLYCKNIKVAPREGCVD